MQQLTFIEVQPDNPVEWCSDDWETPDALAEYMVNLVEFAESILEPAAGTGHIFKHLSDWFCPPIVAAYELNPERFNRLQVVGDGDPYFTVINADFLTAEISEKFEAVIANPPFSQAMAFLEKSLSLLDDSPSSCCIFLLPATFFQSKARAEWFNRLDCRIYQRHSIVGRVAYLKNGVPISGRQCEDCIFDIRLGKEGDSQPEVFVRL